jgi:hypothetical protein
MRLNMDPIRHLLALIWGTAPAARRAPRVLLDR